MTSTLVTLKQGAFFGFCVSQDLKSEDLRKI